MYFRIDREDMFPFLVAMFDALKEAKRTGDFPEVSEWLPLIHPNVRAHFYWPPAEELSVVAEIRATRPIIIMEPSDAIGDEWDFGSILDAVKNGEYQMLEIVKTSSNAGELRIDPEAYPYGGIGAFIALIEAHGMHILGINEYGKYQPRSELVSSEPKEKGRDKPWWKFW